MKNPSLKSYVQGIMLGVIISIIFLGIPMYSSIIKSCDIAKTYCPTSQNISQIFLSIEFTLSTLVLIIISVIFLEHFARLMNSRRT